MPIKPAAVLISDVHYNLQTLELADAAMRQAITKANSLNIPLIVAGDLHDTKANLRGECVNAMLETFSLVKVPTFILIGNHCRLNEKAKEHSLNFLNTCGCNICVVDNPHFTDVGYLVPYYHDLSEIRQYLITLPMGATVIMHQGMQGSKAGEYFSDPTALKPEDVAGLRIVSGHYHCRQTIALPDGGIWDFIGNPFTLNYGEVNDPEKGYQILYNDGSLEFVPTNLRKHRIYEFDVNDIPATGIGYLLALPDDLVQIKIHGTLESLSRFSHALVAKDIGFENFKLDLIPREAEAAPISKKTHVELFDELIDKLDASEERKVILKELWRKLL